MKNLIPHFIQNNLENNIFSGNFKSYTMFIDIVGFTKVTQKLMKKDKEGAEILSDIINNIFSLSINIPENINAVILSRIDKLNEDFKEIIKTASVLGINFLINVLEAMLENKIIEPFLDNGECENIWTAISDSMYIFKHTLIRDTVYGMQLRKNLRKLHKLAAEKIEILSKNDKNYYYDIAYYYGKAEIKDKQISYLIKSGLYFMENYKNDLVLKCFDEALNLIGTNDLKKLLKLIHIKLIFG